MWLPTLIISIMLILCIVGTVLIQAYRMYQTAASVGVKRPVGARHGYITNIASQSANEHITIARYQILIIGDSVIEGIGTHHMYQTIGHEIVRGFSKKLAAAGKSNIVQYHLLGGSGYCAPDMQRDLIPKIHPSFISSKPTKECQSKLNFESNVPFLRREYSTYNDTPVADDVLLDSSCLDKEAQGSLDRALHVAHRSIDQCSFTPLKNMVVISCGTNHATRLHTTSRFYREMCELIDALRTKLGESTPVFIIGMPPLNRFPMPKLLRTCLWFVIQQYDVVLNRLACTLSNVYHLNGLKMFMCEELVRGHPSMPPSVHDAIDQLFESREGEEAIDDVVIVPPRLSGKRPTNPTELFALFMDDDKFHPNHAGYHMMAAIGLCTLIEWDKEHDHQT